MVLVDTSVWIDHFRRNDPGLVSLLAGGEVLAHPFVIGELACGNLRNRTAILEYLSALPPACSATDIETFGIIENHRLWGRGIGWVDSHLLASTLLSGCELWTRDARLNHAAAVVSVKRFRDG